MSNPGPAPAPDAGSPGPGEQSATSSPPGKPDRIAPWVKILGAVAGVILALGGGTGIAALTGAFKDGPSEPPPTTSSVTTPPPTTVPPRILQPLTKDQVSVYCKVEPAPKPGQLVNLTYTIKSKAEGKLDLGAEVYADDGAKFANGFGDIDSHLVEVGEHTVTRPMRVPAELPPGDYEISGELWPEGRKGVSGADTIADATCETFSVP